MNDNVSRKIVFTPDERDFIHFTEVYCRRFGMQRHRKTGAAVIGCAGFLLLYFNLINTRFFYAFPAVYINTLLIIISVCILFEFSAFPLAARIKAKQIFKRIEDYKHPVAMELNGKILRVSKKYTRMTYDLPAIFACCESRTHFCFYPGRFSQNGEFLPKSVLTQQQSEAVSAMLFEVLGKRYRKL